MLIKTSDVMAARGRMQYDYKQKIPEDIPEDSLYIFRVSFTLLSVP